MESEAINDFQKFNRKREERSDMKFFVTFGQKYRRESHPHGGHPDGWFELEAESQGEAREKVFEAIGKSWAFIYTEGGMDKNLFPRGKLRDL